MSTSGTRTSNRQNTASRDTMTTSLCWSTVCNNTSSLTVLRQVPADTFPQVYRALYIAEFNYNRLRPRSCTWLYIEMKDFLLSWPPGQSFWKPRYHSCHTDTKSYFNLSELISYLICSYLKLGQLMLSFWTLDPNSHSSFSPHHYHWVRSHWTWQLRLNETWAGIHKTKYAKRVDSRVNSF